MKLRFNTKVVVMPRNVLVYLAAITISLIILGAALVFWAVVLHMSGIQLVIMAIILIPTVVVGSYLGVRSVQNRQR